MTIQVSLPKGYDSSNCVAGVDISHWEPDVDFHELYSAGIRFVIAKATDGVSLVDQKYPLFKQKADILKKEYDDFFFGGYHFFQPSLPANAQASHFLSIICPVSGDIWPSLDSETSGTGASAGSWNFAAAFRTATGHLPMLYTYEPFYLQYLKAFFGPHVDSKELRLWMARYRSRKPDTPCDIWQFSDDEKVPHEPTTMDADIFFGSIDDFRKKMLVP